MAESKKDDTKSEPQVVAEQPKGSSWLEQVKRDAERVTLKRMRDEEEERAYQAKQEKAGK